MSDLTLIIPMIPKAQKRARSRIVGRGGKQFVQVYTDVDQRNEQDNFKAMLYRQLPENFQLIQGPVCIYIRVLMPIPKCSKKKYQDYLLGSIPHIVKPDCSNLAKHVEDCCNGVLWLDDKQITTLAVKKTYSPEPGWEIRLEW